MSFLYLCPTVQRKREIKKMNRLKCAFCTLKKPFPMSLCRMRNTQCADVHRWRTRCSKSCWLGASFVLSAGMGRIRNVLSHFFPTQVFNVFFRYWYAGGVCLLKNTGRREDSSGIAAKSSNVDQVRIKKHLLFSLKEEKGCSSCLCFREIFWSVGLTYLWVQMEGVGWGVQIRPGGSFPDSPADLSISFGGSSTFSFELCRPLLHLL